MPEHCQKMMQSLKYIFQRKNLDAPKKQFETVLPFANLCPWMAKNILQVEKLSIFKYYNDICLNFTTSATKVGNTMNCPPKKNLKRGIIHVCVDDNLPKIINQVFTYGEHTYRIFIEVTMVSFSPIW